jgi:hypothetical protein
MLEKIDKEIVLSGPVLAQAEQKCVLYFIVEILYGDLKLFI